MFNWPVTLPVLLPRLRQRRLEVEARNDVDPGVQLQDALNTLCRLPDTQPDQNGQRIASEKVQKVSATLQTLHNTRREDSNSWSSRPRTYIILHNLGCPELMNKFIQDEKTDIWLPYDEETLPKFIQPCNVRERFLQYQKYVLTSARALEDRSTDFFSKTLPHVHLEGSGDQHFKRVGALGAGSYGVVEKVYSYLSHKCYARKSVLRHRRNNGAALKYIVEELTKLKQLSHRHLVKILGSYTDTEYIAFLMLPVAEYNLEGFLNKSGGLTDGDRHDLRTFFGCLAGAVDYLHRSKIRHRDLSSRNILVHQGSVIISDFGSAYKWTGNGSQASVTQSHHVPANLFYIAPEVARKAPRSPSSDLWSLGVIFMKMTTVLVGGRVAQLHSLLNEHGRATEEPYLWANPKTVTIWLERLQESNRGPRHDNEPLEWIRDLLNPNPKRRPTSGVLMQDIHNTQSFNIFCCMNCQPVFHDRRFRDIDTRIMDTQTIREEAYEDTADIMQSVARILKEEPLQPIVISSEKQSTIEIWLARSDLHPSMPGAFGADEEDDDIESNSDHPRSSAGRGPQLPILGKDTLLLQPTVEPSQTTTESGVASHHRPNMSLNTSFDTAPQFARDTGLGFFEIESPSSNDDGGFRVLSDSSGSDSDSDVSIILLRSDDDAEDAVPTWELPLFTGPENRLIQTLNSLPEEQEDVDGEMDESVDTEVICESTSFGTPGNSSAIVLSRPNFNTAMTAIDESATEETALVLVKRRMSLLIEEPSTVERAVDVMRRTEGDDTNLGRTVSAIPIVPTIGTMPEDPVGEPRTEIDTQTPLIDTSVKDGGPAQAPDSMDKQPSLEKPEIQKVLGLSNEDLSTRSKKNSSKKRSAHVPKETPTKGEDSMMLPGQPLDSQQGLKTVPAEQGAEPLRPTNNSGSPAMEFSLLSNLSPGSTEENKVVQKPLLHPKPWRKPSVVRAKSNKDVASMPAQSIPREGAVSSPTQVQQDEQKLLHGLNSWREQRPFPQMPLSKDIVSVSAAPICEAETASHPAEVLPRVSKPPLDLETWLKNLTTPPVTLSGDFESSSAGPVPREETSTSLAQVLPDMPKPPLNPKPRRKKSSTPRVAFADNSLPTQRPSARKKSALKPGISASDYIESTWEAASTVATSVMSADTKRLLKGLSLNQWLDRDHKLLETFCHKGKAQAVRVLLEKGCNPGKAGSKAERRQGPITLAIQGASQRHNKCVRALIQAGVDVNVVNRSSGKTPLHLAIENPHFKGYEHLICALIAGGADTNKADHRGDRPVMKVFQGNDIGPLEDYRMKALALLLREASTDVEVTVPGTLNSPLHLAVRCRDAFAVGMLLYKKANVNAKNAAGSTPLLIAAHQFHNPMMKDQVETLNILLHTEGINVNEKAGVKEQTALHYAVQAGVAWAVERLLEHGADPNCRDSEDRDAYALARDCAEKWTPEDRDSIMRQLQDASVLQKPCNKLGPFDSASASPPRAFESKNVG